MDLVDPAIEFKEIAELVSKGATPSSNINQVLTRIKKYGSKRNNNIKFSNIDVFSISEYSVDVIKDQIKNLYVKLNELTELDNCFQIFTECDKFTLEQSDKLLKKLFYFRHFYLN